MDTRILELALETLIARKTAVEAEIAEIRAELEGRAPSPKSSRGTKMVSRRRRARTPAERKAQSERMKLYWAARRAEAAKKTASGKKSKARK